MKVIGIIPARMASSRFPGKPLSSIAGISMIEHVYRRARLCKRFAEVYVATPDAEIKDAVNRFGGGVIMTSDHHQRGTERVAEAASKLQADVVANIQGDEPLLMPEYLDKMIQPFSEDPSITATNLMAPIHSSEELLNLNIVKVVCDQAQNAMYFSRLPIPTQKKGTITHAFRQLGLYAFTHAMLMKYQSLPSGPFEELESVDMLRFLENGFKLRMVPCDRATHGVDTEQDRTEAEHQMASDSLWPLYRPKQAIA